MALLNKKSIGLDIADRSIEAVELESSDGSFKVLNLISASLPEGVVENGRIKDGKKLAEAVKIIFSGKRPKPLSSHKVVFGLPESQVFLHNFHLGYHNKKDRDELVLQEVLLNIPVKEGDLIYSYKIISDTFTGVKILVAATSQTVVKEWLDFFKSVDIEAEILDIEILAVFRGLFTKLPQKPICVLDIGSHTANVCIFDQFGLRYSFSSFIAGDALTNAIMKTEGMDWQTAEAQKIKDGLASRNKKNVAAMADELMKINNTLKEALDYLKTETNESVAEIILVGGASQLKGLVDYFKKTFDKNVYVGASRLHYEKMPLIYIEATGLAIRGLDKDWDDKDPSIPKQFKDGKNKFVFANSLKKDEEKIGKVQRKKIDKKVIFLIIILLVGAILLAAIFWFRSSQQKSKIEKTSIKMNFPVASVRNSLK